MQQQMEQRYLTVFSGIFTAMLAVCQKYCTINCVMYLLYCGTSELVDCCNDRVIVQLMHDVASVRVFYSNFTS